MLTVADISQEKAIEAATTLQQDIRNMKTQPNDVCDSIEEYYELLHRAHDTGTKSWSVAWGIICPGQPYVVSG